MGKTRYRKALYIIEMPGMASDCIGFSGFVTVDSKYALIQLHPTYSIAIAPPAGIAHPTFEEVVFYTNCLAYEHDLPAILLPVKRKALAQPIEKGRSKYINDSYFESLCLVYEALNSIRLGPLGCVYFRWPGLDSVIDLPYTKKYSKVAKELSLYSTAVRQLDPLSEFLGYYRVIESVSGTKAKESKGWISENLSRLESYKFGFLKFSDAEGRQRTNVFSIYKRRALVRLRYLINKLGSEACVTDYFYYENRCGIAHGGKIKEYDFKYTLEEISKDNYILKLLSIIAIEDKIK